MWSRTESHLIGPSGRCTALAHHLTLHTSVTHWVALHYTARENHLTLQTSVTHCTALHSASKPLNPSHVSNALHYTVLANHLTLHTSVTLCVDCITGRSCLGSREASSECGAAPVSQTNKEAITVLYRPITDIQARVLCQWFSSLRPHSPPPSLSLTYALYACVHLTL